MKKNLRVIAVIILALSMSVCGQSIFSLTYPFGLPLRSLSSTALSMGGVSIGVPNDHNVMISNPGNLGTIDITAFSSLLLIDYLRINDAGLYTDHLEAKPRQVSFALPIGFAGTLAFSLLKNTDATIKYRQDKILRNTEDISSLIYSRVSFDNTGGTMSWQAGWGHKFGKFISIGIAYQRLYFSVYKTKITDVTIYSNMYYDTIQNQTMYSTIDEITERDSTHIKARGNGLRLGLMGTIKKLSIGVAANYFFKDYFTYYKATYNGNSSSPINIKNVSEARPSLQLPPSVAMGLSYAISPKWLIGADISCDLWKYYSINRGNILADIDKDNTISLCAGFRFIPAPNLLVPKYWETIHYRAGARYSQLPGNKSSESSVSLGFGFPLRGNGLLDMGVELGKRSGKAYDNYNETFLQVSIGINGGRKWHKSTTGSY